MAHQCVNVSHAPDPRGLSRYQFVAVIGRGGMAEVFVALRRDEGALDQKVVIKQLRADVAEDDDFRTMFLDEARLATCLVHPNVVRTLDAGREGSRCYIVMEFLDGQPFSRIQNRAKSEGRLPLSVQLYALGEVLRGLDYVHQLAKEDGEPLGVVHRDVTPHNVFICYDGRVKLLDFGIAKAAARIAETKIGVVKGKLAYMAPEHLRGGAVDRRSDIFSVGVMLWEAIVGRRFWGTHDELTIYRRLLAGHLPEIESEASIHPVLVSILERALAVDVERRYRTASEMRADMVAALREIAPDVGTADVAACAGELFFRERTALDALLRRAQRGPRLGELSAADGGLLGEADISLFGDNAETRVWQAGATSQRRTTLSGSVAAASIEDEIDFRAGSRRFRAFAWLVVVGVAGFTVASSLVRPSPTVSPSPAPTAVERETAAPSTPTILPATAPEPTVAASVLSRATRAPTPARASRPVAPPLHPGPIIFRQLPTTLDDLPKGQRTHRALDKDDPWSE